MMFGLICSNRDIFERAHTDHFGTEEAKIPFNQTAAGQEEEELAALLEKKPHGCRKIWRRTGPKLD
jgi:hypothetical protein